MRNCTSLCSAVFALAPVGFGVAVAVGFSVSVEVGFGVAGEGTGIIWKV